MSELQANDLAKSLGWATEIDWRTRHTGGNLWIVYRVLSDGSLVVFGDDSVGAYASSEAFDSGHVGSCIVFESE